MRGVSVLLVCLAVCTAVGVGAGDKSILERVLSEEPAEPGAFNQDQQTRLRELIPELVRRIANREEPLRGQVEFAVHVRKYREAFKNSFADLYVDGKLTFHADKTTTGFNSLSFLEDGQSWSAEDFVVDVAENLLKPKFEDEQAEKERDDNVLDLDDLFGPLRTRGPRSLAALRIEFIQSIPSGDVRVLLNDLPFESVRFISPHVLEALVPAEVLEDDRVYTTSYVEILVDDDTISWIPLKNLITEKQRSVFVKQLRNVQQQWNVSATDVAGDSEQDVLEDEQSLELLYESATTALEDGEDEKAVTELLALAKRGHDGAIATLAMMHFSGLPDHIAQDTAEGVRLLRHASSMGNSDAHAMMAMLHGTGIAAEYVQPDKARELLYLNLGAKGGSTYALAALANRYMYGINVKDHCATAAHYYSIAAGLMLKDANEIDFRHAYVPVDSVYLTDGMQLTPYDHQVEMFKLYKNYAELGDVDLQVNVGKVLVNGANGIPANIEKAKELLWRAANAGNAHARARLGYLYYEGAEGVPADNKTAVEHFKAAANQRDPFALNAMGICHARGAGVELNPTIAAEYFEKAIKISKYPGAYYNLGLLYLHGSGVPKSIDKAINYFRVAADSTHLHAIFQLGRLSSGAYEKYMNCPRAVQNLKVVVEKTLTTPLVEQALLSYRDGDYDAALYRYLQAAFMGDEVAQFNAGFLIQRGLGVRGAIAGNEVKHALEYYRLSSQQDNSRATLRVGDILYAEGDYVGSYAAYRDVSSTNVPEALFNLGVMHVTGKGVARDYHMAKRYFDQVREILPDGKLPGTMALYALRFCSSRHELCDFLVELGDFLWRRSNNQEATCPSFAAVWKTLKSELQSRHLGWLVSSVKGNWDLGLMLGLLALLLRVLRLLRGRGRVPMNNNNNNNNNDNGINGNLVNDFGLNNDNQNNVAFIDNNDQNNVAFIDNNDQNNVAFIDNNDQNNVAFNDRNNENRGDFNDNNNVDLDPVDQM